MVAVQPHWYSWDFMPRVLRKPYAVTTLSHLVEMAAMLGVHWKVFDRAGHHYQAEGNGFLLSGTYDPDVGICFDLQQVRSPIFGARRIVPVDEVKDLCFGYVPTIFHPQGAPIYRRLIEQRDSDDDKFEDGLSMLSLGSDGETAETMLSLGLTMDATRFFTDSDRRLAHLFPGRSLTISLCAARISPKRLTRSKVHFELIGMLARNLHIPHSLFRYLPNPVPHRWDRRAFSVLQLLNAFCAEMNALGPPIDLTPLVATAHHVLQRSGSDCRRPASECHCAPCLEALSDALSACDQVLADEEIRETVLDVLARHFTQVLLLLNGHLELEDDPLLEDLTRGRSPRRERALMRLYFVAVRPAVTRLSDVGGDDDDGERRGTRGGVVVPPWSPDGAAGAEAPVGEKRPPTVPSRLAIWCYLVFRMLCWLQLHDFHKDDVMLPRSSLTGSRLQAVASVKEGNPNKTSRPPTPEGLNVSSRALATPEPALKKATPLTLGVHVIVPGLGLTCFLKKGSLHFRVLSTRLRLFVIFKHFLGPPAQPCSQSCL
ncbi:hypothetical protein VTK73DRAFT_4666 [Phialemonium thermophilum]|uniref:Uncharacterized protein n=1 Tax=Phialemonium thermophilum TaxID=223376 RepID=A0ABR3V6X0_9PEZI